MGGRVLIGLHGVGSVMGARLLATSAALVGISLHGCGVPPRLHEYSVCFKEASHVWSPDATCPESFKSCIPREGIVNCLKSAGGFAGVGPRHSTDGSCACVHSIPQFFNDVLSCC